MKDIVGGLEVMQARCRGASAGLLGGLLAVLVEGAKYMRDAERVARDEYKSLKDRVKTLEEEVGTPSAGHSTSGGGSTATGAVNPPSTHDLAVAGADLGSNNGAAGGFASPYLTVNAANTTGIGASSTCGLLNLVQGDRQLVRSHAVTFNAVGTPGTPSVSSPVRLGSLTFPQAFDRPPRIRVSALNAGAGGLSVHVNPYVNGTGYDLVADGGTVTSGQSYSFSVTVDPN